MVDLIYGRGITDLSRELPSLFILFKNIMLYRLFHEKRPLYASVDINNVCNLHCSHCYWWLNRKDGEPELTVDDWRRIIRNVIKRKGIYFVFLVGGEPTLRPDIIQLFSNELPRRVSVVTNATFPLARFAHLYNYWVSIDGTELIHDTIRGKGAYAKTKRNIMDYISGPPRNGKPAWKDIWISVTVNSLNYSTIESLTQEWYGKINKIAYQFHTPFIKGDPLWLPYGTQRSKVVNTMLSLKNKYPNFVINDFRQLSLMKKSWGGIGTTPIDCPTWTILPLDHMGRIKQPCCIGSAESKADKPICEDCGLACYSAFLGQGLKGK